MTFFLIADKETESQRFIKFPKVTQTDFDSGISKLKAHEFCFLFFFLLFFFIVVKHNMRSSSNTFLSVQYSIITKDTVLYSKTLELNYLE